MSTSSTSATSVEDFDIKGSDTASTMSSTTNLVGDPVVIVGLACRLPGAENPSQLWNNIVAKKDLQKKMPADRFNVDAFYNDNGKNKGTVSSSHRFQRAFTNYTDQRPIRIFP